MTWPTRRPLDQLIASAYKGEVGREEDGYEAEIVELFRAEATRLKGYLIRLGADRSLVDDIVQDSFLATHRRWASVRTYEKPAGYLYRVATNRMRRLYRITYGKSEPHAYPDETAYACAGRDPSHESDQRLLLELALRRLARRQREVILLYYVYGFRVSEVASILVISEGSVKNYLYLGRRRLAEILGEDDR